jgi:ATP-dependent Lhr-like helicase
MAGFLTVDEGHSIPSAFFDALALARRATRTASIWVAAERLPELLAVHPEAVLDPAITAPAGRAAKAWTREEAIVELLRGRVSIAGPTDAAALARSLSVSEADAHGALIDLEGQGLVLRGRFTPSTALRADGLQLEFCDRSLLARIHRYTLNRLRAEIEPVSVADFTRFLFAWQHVDAASRLTGAEGLRAVVARLDGFELPARAWERSVLPARLDRYDAAMLDMLCLAGQASWSRLSSPSADGNGRALRVALCLREHACAWQALRFSDTTTPDTIEEGLDDTSQHVLAVLRSGGASFLRDLSRAAEVGGDALTSAVAALVSRGLVTSDGFAGVRALLRAMKQQPVPFDQARDLTGRWSALPAGAQLTRDAAVEVCARSLLGRYGVMFRRLLTREINAPSWRELTRVYRRLEARGEIRGGRFVTGVSGEQFALPEAVERLRDVRRSAPDGRLVTISTADPLNLTGILAGDDRVRAVTSNRIVYRDGIAVAALEGDYLRPLTPIDPAAAAEVASAAAGRRMPAVASGFLGR